MGILTNIAAQTVGVATWLLLKKGASKATTNMILKRVPLIAGGALIETGIGFSLKKLGKILGKAWGREKNGKK